MCEQGRYLVGGLWRFWKDGSMCAQVITTVSVELTGQEISYLLSALITAPHGIADQLIARLAHAYHQSRCAPTETDAGEPEFVELHALVGIVAAPLHDYGDVVLIAGG